MENLRLIHVQHGVWAVVSDDGYESFATNKKDGQRLLKAYNAGFEPSNRMGQKLAEFTPDVTEAIENSAI